jgi:hypothetical protein
MFDLTSFDKVNLILLQTLITVIPEGDNIRKNGGAFVEAVQYNPESCGDESRCFHRNFSLI